MLRWPMRLFSLPTYMHRDTHTHFWRCSRLLSIKTRTHAGMDTAHVLTRPYTNTHSQAVNVVGRKWRQLGFYGFIWPVIFIWPSQVFTVSLSHTHTLIIPSPFWCSVGLEHRESGPEGILLGTYSDAIIFFPFQTGLTLHKFLFMVRSLGKAGGGRFYTSHSHLGAAKWCPFLLLLAAKQLCGTIKWYYSLQIY